MDYASLIAGLASAIGQMSAQGDENGASDLIRRALARLGPEALPDLQEAVANQLGPSEAGNVKADPSLVAAQMAALNKLQEVSDAGGFTLEDKAALNKISNRVARQETAGRNAITNNMDARGIGGSGAELALMMGNNQAAAQRSSEEGMDLAGKAERRALDAMMRSGQMAGDMRGQDYSERSKSAQARDEIAKYNASARDRAQYYNLGVPQQAFENKLQLSGLMSKGEADAAKDRRGAAQDTRQKWANFGQLGADMYTGAANQTKKDEDEDKYDTDWANPFPYRG